MVDRLLKDKECLQRECVSLRQRHLHTDHEPRPSRPVDPRTDGLYSARLRASEAVAIESRSELASLWASWQSTETRLRDVERDNIELSCALEDMRKVGELQTAAVRELTTHGDAKDMTIRNLIESREGTMMVVSELEQVVGELRASLAVERERRFLLEVELDRFRDCDAQRAEAVRQHAHAEQARSEVRESFEQLKRQCDAKRIRVVELEMQLEAVQRALPLPK
jgi:chromosome segregation ATPase